MNTELVVTVFDGEDAASAAYQALRQLEQNGAIAILDAATWSSTRTVQLRSRTPRMWTHAMARTSA
jgi:uncharacterized membrane protein